MAGDLPPLHILCIGAQARGHMLPLLHVVEACKSRGHKVTLCTEDYGVEGIQPLATKAGVDLVPIVTGKTLEQFEKENAEGNVIPFLPMREAMLPSAKEVLERLKPDVVLCDFATLAGSQAATDLGIPLVVNCPGPVEMLALLLGMPDSQPYYQSGGLHFRFNCLHGLGMKFATFTNLMGIGDMAGFIRDSGLRGAKFLVHSFFGLEPPRELPPQIRLIGPVLPPAAELATRFQKSHEELHQWLHADGAPPTIMITTGSLVKLHPWQVRELFLAVKEAGLRAVWSLKADSQAHLPQKDDPSFWIGPWLPQAELLSDPKVAAVVTHCGWGGTLECLSVGKPVVCLPFFGDQPGNAQILVRAGCGELLAKLPKMTFSAENPYKEGDFTAKSAALILQRVVADPKYRAGAQKMQRAALHSGGAAQAAREVEWSARFGNENLGNRQIHRTWGGSPVAGGLAACFAGAAAGAFHCFHGPGLAVVGLLGCTAGAARSVRKRLGAGTRSRKQKVGRSISRSLSGIPQGVLDFKEDA